MSIVFHSLTDVELLRFAHTSPLMDSPLFAEIVARFDADTAYDRLHELHQQQEDTRATPPVVSRQVKLISKTPYLL